MGNRNIRGCFRLLRIFLEKKVYRFVLLSLLKKFCPISCIRELLFKLLIVTLTFVIRGSGEETSLHYSWLCRIQQFSLLCCINWRQWYLVLRRQVCSDLLLPLVYTIRDNMMMFLIAFWRKRTCDCAHECIFSIILLLIISCLIHSLFFFSLLQKIIFN